MNQQQLQQILVFGFGVGIVVALALVIGLILPRWANPNFGSTTKLNLLAEVPPQYDRTRMASVEEQGDLWPSWQSHGDPSSKEGYVMYVGHGCASCHGLEGRGGAVAGAVVGLAGDVFRFFVRAGPGGMPAYSAEELSEEHLNAIIAWAAAPEATPVPTPSPPPAASAVPTPTNTPSPTPVATLTATPTPAVALPSPTPTPTPASAGEPPVVPHRLEGRADCLLCHNRGSIRPFPADHVGRGNESCLVCHRGKP